MKCFFTLRDLRRKYYGKTHLYVEGCVFFEDNTLTDIYVYDILRHIDKYQCEVRKDECNRCSSYM